MSVRRINIAAILSVSVATFSSSAYAEIVTFYFEGPVGYYVDPDCPSDLGNFVTGSVTFDTSTSPTSLSPVRNAYYDAVTSFNFSTKGVD